MKKNLLILLSAAILSLSFAAISFATDPLLQQSDLTYMGAFRVPQTGSSCASFQYGGRSVAFNPVNNSLFLTGSTACDEVAEISIPTPICLDGGGNAVSCATYTPPTNATGSLGNLNTAAVLQNFADITEGNSYNICQNSNCSGNGTVNTGLLVYNGELIGDTKAYYDALDKQIYSHFTNSTNLLTNSFSGYYELNTGLFAGLSPGPMTVIPAAYQSQLGGKVLTGQGPGTGIVTTLSYGPCAIAFDPANMVPSNLPSKTVPATVLAYYNAPHPLPGGQWAGDQAANPYTSPADSIGGVVFPDGTRSVLYFGVHGKASTDGYACYGAGTSSLAATYADACPAGIGTCQYSERLVGFAGTVTSGTFISGETVTQAGTNATGTLVRLDPRAGLEFLKSSAPQGANTAGVWTGQTSKATFAPTPGGIVGDEVCYDPADSSKGVHAYPYVNYVWAYDVGNPNGTNTTGNNVNSLSATNPGENNLTAVKLGLIQPYEVIPYATWTFTLPTGASQLVPGNFSGATWDPVHSRIYVTQKNADKSAYASFPLVHVFQVAVKSSATALPTVTGLSLVN